MMPPRQQPETADRRRPARSTLRLRRVGIDTYQEPVIYMRADCAVCRAEGFEAQSRAVPWRPDRVTTRNPGLVPATRRQAHP